MIYLKIVFNSLLWAMAIALSCFKSEWLEMRVNIGYIFFASTIILSTILTIANKKNTLKLSLRFTILNILITFCYEIFLYGFKRIQIVPASIIREGFHQTKIPFSIINRFFLIIMICGIIFIILDEILLKRKLSDK